MKHTEWAFMACKTTNYYKAYKKKTRWKWFHINLMRERCLQWESLSKMVVIYIGMYALLSAGGIKRQIQLSQMMKIKEEWTNSVLGDFSAEIKMCGRTFPMECKSMKTFLCNSKWHEIYRMWGKCLCWLLDFSHSKMSFQ